MDLSNDITTGIAKKEHILPPTSSQFYTPLQYMHIIKYCVNLLTFQ